jgi:fluoroquinolone resistance protein
MAKQAAPSQAQRLSAEESFEDETFEGVDAHEVDLGHKEFYRCTFRNAKLQETGWARTRLEDCLFEGCDLTRARPAQLALRTVAFKHCKLMGIDWSNLATYPDVSFEECNLRYASFVSAQLRKTRFVQCSLLEANFLQVELGEAVFEACQLSGARFEDCDLRGASFLRCVELFVDPSKNRVQGMTIPTESAVLLALSFGMKIKD